MCMYVVWHTYVHGAPSMSYHSIPQTTQEVPLYLVKLDTLTSPRPFLTPCTGVWCVPHHMYWSMVHASMIPHYVHMMAEVVPTYIKKLSLYHNSNLTYKCLIYKNTVYIAYITFQCVCMCGVAYVCTVAVK